MFNIEVYVMLVLPHERTIRRSAESAENIYKNINIHFCMNMRAWAATGGRVPLGRPGPS